MKCRAAPSKLLDMAKPAGLWVEKKLLEPRSLPPPENSNPRVFAHLPSANDGKIRLPAG
jgi:hypothetical protein